MAVANKGTRFFQFYLDNYFNFPTELKNDIIYCQRAFHAHLKVHQLIVSNIKLDDVNLSLKENSLKELEDDMLLINGEQNFLLLRLRRFIDEFYKSVQRVGISIDNELTNNLIFREVAPYINDEQVDIKPLSVHSYNTEEILMEKHASALHSRSNVQVKVEDGVQLEKKSPPGSGSMSMPPSVAPNHNSASNGVYGNRNGNHFSQVSLLKPISQRIVSQHGNNVAKRSLYNESSSSHSSYVRKAPFELPRNANVPNLPVSKNVTMSRLNLQQALKKAKTDTLAAKASANVLAKPVAPNATATATSQPAAQKTVASAPVAAPPVKTKAETKAAKAAAKANAKLAASNSAATRNLKPRAPSTSEEEMSPAEREPTPPMVATRGEELTLKTMPDDYGQEMFLRILGLVTPQVQLQMQQRRSKRRRRAVHHNEHTDYHYGRIDYVPSIDDKQKNKAFLLSPQAKRPKKARAKQDCEEPTSRSSSSSPEETRVCNECLKQKGSFDQCDDCKGFYHPSCHPPVNANAAKIGVSNSKRSVAVEPTKSCPACSRLQMNLIKKETEHYESLNSTVKELEHKMAAEKHRRASLQQTSKLFKTQMRQLFNIVKTFKSDNEVESSD